MALKLNEFKNDLLFLPLGGTEQIGINLYLYHYKGQWLIVDMGLGFADDNFPGIDILVPDISFITQNIDNFAGVMLTHAHEDHIGAIQYLWNQFKLPIYCTNFTASVLKTKLTNMGLVNEIEINVKPVNTRFNIGNFDLEMIGLTHSVPEMQGLVFRTEYGNVFHTGDWKFDKQPIIGEVTNMKALEKLGKEGVLAMVGDSTNIFSDGVSGSEGDLVKSLTDLVGTFKNNLVVITSFASNTARLHTIAKAAEANGRKVALAGSSLWKMYNAALECGYMEDIPSFIKTKDLPKYNRDQILILATGCQGEHNATTSKLAREEHPDIKLRRGDAIIFSSKIIPGNEQKIFGLFNKFCKMGIEVLTEKDHFVHVSGHPARDEVAKMYEIIKPKIAIPVHGQPMHLHEHAKFATAHGVKYAVQMNNGAVVKINGDKPKIVATVPTQVMAVDGNFIIPADSDILSSRRRIRDHGAIFVTVIMDKNNNLVHPVEVLAPGVLDTNEDKEYFDLLSGNIEDYVDKNRKAKRGDMDNKIRHIIKKIAKSEIGKEPKIFVQILTVG